MGSFPTRHNTGSAHEAVRIWDEETFLGGLPPNARERCLQLGRRGTYPRSSVLMRQGELSSQVLVILDGLVKLSSITEDGTQVLLSIRHAGDLIGELEVTGQGPRTVTVTSVGPVDARIIARQEFVWFLEREPAAAMVLIRTVTHNLREATSRRVEFVSNPADVRIARLLCELATYYGERQPEGIRVPVPLSQAELSSMAGVSKATMEKTLQLLRRGEIIGTRYRSIVIYDMQALRAMAG